MCIYVGTYHTICAYSNARSVQSLHTVNTIHTVRSVHTVNLHILTNRVTCRRIGDVFFSQHSQCPTIHGNVLHGAEEAYSGWLHDCRFVDTCCCLWMAYFSFGSVLTDHLPFIYGGGIHWGGDTSDRLYKSPTDYTKPRNVRQSPRNTIQSPDRQCKAPTDNTKT